MEILETTLSIGRTVNLGNYESLRVDLSIRSKFDSEESYESEIKEMEDVLASNLETIVERQINYTRKDKEEEFI